MKKLLGLLALLLLLLLVGAGFTWIDRSRAAALLMSRHLGVPVSIGSLDLTSKEVLFRNFTIGNPVGFHSPSAFTAQSINLSSTIAQIRGDPLIIDEIDMSNLLITIEHPRTRDATNWSQILKSSRAPSKRHYLIRTLILRNLTVQVMNTDGTMKRYPPLEYLEFSNISDDTGFPISEIEKAIFNSIMHDVFKKFHDIQKLFNPFNSIPGMEIPLFK